MENVTLWILAASLAGMVIGWLAAALRTQQARVAHEQALGALDSQLAAAQSG